jgi:iron complex outermembrane receptor protein
LDLTFGMDFVNAETQSDNTDLPRIPPIRYRAGAVWEYNALRLGTEIMFVDGQDNLAPQELPTDAYELWSAYAAYRFVTGDTAWDLLLRGSNLTDSEARMHTSFLKDVVPLPGRNVTVSVRMSF